MKNILLIPNPKKDIDFAVTAATVEKFSSLGFCMYCLPEHAYGIKGAKAVEDIGIVDLVFVIGGDGSILDASSLAIENDIPLIGLNLGKIGYLTEIDKDDIDALYALRDGRYEIEEKMLLSVEISGKSEKNNKFAVNDCIISHESYLGVADFSLLTNTGEVLNYRADGLVVSTPVGSTAYSLSAGGPVVSHGVDAVVVTPICPHSFFNRSLILPGNNMLTLSNTGKDKLNVSLDGRYFSALMPGESCVVKVADKKLKMLTLKKDKMISALFSKMKLMEITE